MCECERQRQEVAGDWRYVSECERQRQEVAGDWGKLHGEELNDLCCSSNAIRMTTSSTMRWAGHVARMGEKRYTFRVLMGKYGGKRPLGSPTP